MDLVSHSLMTRAALEVLPRPHRDLLAGQTDELVNLYCIYPDIWRWKKCGDIHDNAVKYGHVPIEETEPYSVMPDGTPAGMARDQEVSARSTRHYLESILGAIGDGDIPRAAKFLGSYAHYLQDHGCAAHIQADVLAGLVHLEPPPGDGREYVSLHFLFENENTPYECNLAGYEPRLLGRTPAEAVFHLLERYQDIERAKMRSVLPYLRSLYARDEEAGKRARLMPATVTGEALADFFYTVLSISAGGLDEVECERLEEVALETVTPAKVESWHCNTYFEAPIVNASLGECTAFGWPRVPMALSVDGETRQIARGIGVGADNRIIFDIRGVFSRFRCLVGMHVELGLEGRMRFTVEIDGKEAFDSGVLSGRDGAAPVNLSVEGAKTLALVAHAVETRPGESGWRTPDHGVWAEPTLTAAEPAVNP